MKKFDPTVIVFALMTALLLAFSVFVLVQLEETVVGWTLMALFVFDAIILVALLRVPPAEPRRAEEDEEYPDFLR